MLKVTFLICVALFSVFCTAEDLEDGELIAIAGVSIEKLHINTKSPITLLIRFFGMVNEHRLLLSLMTQTRTSVSTILDPDN